MSKFKKIQLYSVMLCIAFFTCIGVCGKLDVQAGEADWTVSSDDEFVINENGVLEEYTGTAEVLMIPEGVKEIGQFRLTAENKADIKKIVLPDSVETLGRSSFQDYTNLEEVVMGSGLKTVNYHAFANDNKVKLLRG